MAEGEEVRARVGQSQETGTVQANTTDSELGYRHEIHPRLDEFKIQFDRPNAHEAAVAAVRRDRP